MRLESEHTHYRARFEVFAYESQDDVAPHIMQTMYNWICGKESKRSKGGEESGLLRYLEDTAFNYHVDHPAHVSSGCYTSRSLLEGMSFPSGYDGGIASGGDSKLCSRSMAGCGEPSMPQYWAMDYDEPDGRLWARRWHTSVGIVSKGNSCVVSVRITNYLDPRYVGNPPKQPNSTTPNFVRELIGLRGFRTHVGNLVLSEKATRLTILNFRERFLSSLLSRERELPIILVSTDIDGKPPVDVGSLAYKVLGLAKVYLLDYSDYDLRRLLRETFVAGTPSFDYRVGAGYVRVYRPGVNLSRAEDAGRHRFFSKDDFERYGSEFNDMLTRSLTRGWVQDSEDVVDVLDVAARARRARNAELRERLDKLTSDTRARSNEERALPQEGDRGTSVAELMRMLAERDRMIDELEENSVLWQEMAEEYASDLEIATADAEKERDKVQAQAAGYLAEIAERDSSIADLGDTISRLEYELKAARGQAGDLSSRLAAANHALCLYEAIAHVPDRLSELLALLAELYPERVCVLPEAVKSAKAFDNRYDLDDELMILRSVPTILWDLYFGDSPSTNIPSDYQALSGFELALTEGSMTNKATKYMKQRQRTYHGEEILILPHIKGRSNTPKDAFRLHYYVDSKRRLIVIGHCGEHLNTAGTKKAT